MSAADTDLERLLEAMCNGTISQDESARLDSLLETSEDARRFYNNYMFLHAELYSQHASLGAVETLAESHAPAYESFDRTPYRWLALAAALIAVALGSSWLTYFISRPTESKLAEVADSTGTEKTSQVARISATRNCMWGNSGKNLGFGSQLSAGEHLDLVTGFVEVTFSDGAVVVLEGPARFDVQSSDRVQLHDGRLAATVPERAHGFQVATSRLNVVDLGTEFGMMADSAGTAEVHVFNGLVKAQLLDERGNQLRTMELNTAEAARIEPAASLVARIPARDDEFVRSLSVASGPHDGPYAYEGFNYP